MALVIVFGLMAAATVWFGARGAWRWAAAGREARAEWAARAQGVDPRLAGLTQADFVGAYRHIHGGRAEFYLAAALAFGLLATPVILFVLSAVLRVLLGDLVQLEFVAGRGRVVVTGQDIFGFFLALSLPLVWAGVTFVFMLRYHRGRMFSLDDALIARRLATKKDTSNAPGAADAAEL